jgi:hypothetical protein
VSGSAWYVLRSGYPSGSFPSACCGGSALCSERWSLGERSRRCCGVEFEFEGGGEGGGGGGGGDMELRR